MISPPSGARLCADGQTTFERPRPDWFTSWHPFGTIPGLRDGDFLLGESNTILRYLARREGRVDLYPDDPRGQARVD